MEALQPVEHKLFCLCDAEGKARKQYIVTGGSNQEYQFVKSGLQAGQSVISAGTHKIMMDGMAVEVAK